MSAKGVKCKEEKKIEGEERKVKRERIHQGLRRSTACKISIYTNTLTQIIYKERKGEKKIHATLSSQNGPARKTE